MIMYSGLKRDFKGADLVRVAANLQRLIVQLDRDVPSKDSEHNLLLATWNIRDFDKGKDGSDPAKSRFGNGPRLRETHYYIAEILSRFDFVAVQEINELDEWYRVMSILGRNWDFIATDVSDFEAGGNGERLLYLYDKRKVWFQNIAGEIVLPRKLLITEVEVPTDDDLARGKQFRRSPFTAQFQSGWFKFDISTVHIFYGEDSGPQLQERVNEIDRIAQYLSKRAKQALKIGRGTILLGDFNIVNPNHKTMEALKRGGFVLPKALDRPNNLDMTKYYDQIAFITKKDVLDYIDRPAAIGERANAGIFEIFESVFRPEDFETYRAAVVASSAGAKQTPEKLPKFYDDKWKTFQMSDHKPMWVRIKVNEAGPYLDKLATPVA